VVPGKTEGLSMGTNFSLLMSVLPTKYFPDTAEKIWFLEDVNIPPNVIDRYIDTIIISDKIKNVNGFAIGSFSRVPSVEGLPSVEDIVVERFVLLNKPTLYSLPFGHGERQTILPLNAKMKISSEEPYLEILENVVD
jgi:muramoyltetrapeptide carboxypeptidase